MADETPDEGKTQAPEFPLADGEVFGPDGSPRPNVISGYASHGNDLLRWQAQARRVGFTIPTTENRRYGTQGKTLLDHYTARAVVAVQKRAEMPVTGLIDNATWAAVWALPSQ